MENLSHIFHLNILGIHNKYEHIFSLEVLGVIAGFKKIAKLEPFSREDITKITPSLKKLGLEYIIFEKKEHFIEKDMIFKKTQASDFIDIYIAKKRSILDLVERLHAGNDTQKNTFLGKLLGYPDCCVGSFMNQNYTSDIDFNTKIKNKTIGKFDWRLNNLINPYSLIPFFPCSYNCKKAIEYAQNNLNIIGNAQEIQKIFQNKIIYSGFWDAKIYHDNKDDKRNINNNDIFDFGE